MQIGPSAIQLPIPDGAEVEVVNEGPYVIYYGNYDVSSASNLGSIPANGRRVFNDSNYLVSPSGMSTIFWISPPKTLYAGGDAIYLPAISGGDDTPALQAVLEQGAGSGRVVRGRSGANYSITQLICPSGLNLDMTGCTITQPASTNKPAFVNQAAIPQRTVTDGAMTIAGADVESATAAFTSADVGRMIAVFTNFTNREGPGPGEGVYYGTITSITSATKVAVKAAHSLLPNAEKTVSACTVQIFNRDENVKIRGGTWVGGNNSGAASIYPWAAQFLVFRRIDGLEFYPERIEHTLAVTGKYAVGISDCTQWRARATINSYSDAFHVDGPNSSGTIEGLFGETLHDDFCALTAGEYLAYADTIGDITDITINNDMPTKCYGSVIKVLGGAGCLMDRITGKGFRGTTTTTTPVYVGGESGGAHPTEEGGTYGCIELEDIQVVAPTGKHTVAITVPNITKLRLQGTYKQVTEQEACVALNMTGDCAGLIELEFAHAMAVAKEPRFLEINNSGHAASDVVLKNYTLTGGVLGSNSYIVTFTDPSVTSSIGTLTFVDPNIELGDAQTNLVGATTAFAGKSGVKRLVIRGGRVIKGRALLQLVAEWPATELCLEGCEIRKISRLVDTAGAAVKVHFGAGVLLDTVANPPFFLEGASTKVTLDGVLPTLITPPVWFQLAAGAVSTNTSVIFAPYVTNGTAKLVAGTIQVADTQITAASRIRLTNVLPEGTVGTPSVAVTAATRFTINSSNTADTSTYYYEIAQY